MTEHSPIPESAVRHNITPLAYEQMLEIVGSCVTGLTRFPESANTPPLSTDPALSESPLPGVNSAGLPSVPFEMAVVKRDLESLLRSAAVLRAFRLGEVDLRSVRERFGRTGDPFVHVVRPLELGELGSGGSAPESGEAGAGEGVALTVVEIGGVGGLRGSMANEVALIEGSRRLICRGAVPIGAVLLACQVGGADDLEETFAATCGALELVGYCGSPVESSEAPESVETVRRLLMFGWVGEVGLETPSAFQKEGEAILLLGHPVECRSALQGLGCSRWWLEVRGNPVGELPKVHLDEVVSMNDGLRMLLHGGCVRSAIPCATGGLAVAVSLACVGGVTPLGASLDLTGLDGAEVKDGETPVRWDALWFGEATGRVVFTVASIDAGKVMAQARILGIPAMLIGRTGGDQLSMKTSQGELSWGLAELKG